MAWFSLDEFRGCAPLQSHLSSKLLIIVAGILKQGLRIAPPEGVSVALLSCSNRLRILFAFLQLLPLVWFLTTYRQHMNDIMPGYMFGKGVYFADVRFVPSNLRIV